MASFDARMADDRNPPMTALAGVPLLRTQRIRQLRATASSRPSHTTVSTSSRRRNSRRQESNEYPGSVSLKTLPISQRRRFGCSIVRPTGRLSPWHGNTCADSGSSLDADVCNSICPVSGRRSGEPLSFNSL